MNRKMVFSKNDAKYRNARTSLLMIVILSFLNIFSISFGQGYYAFSTYISQLFIIIGNALSKELGSNVYLIVGCVIAAITVIPYLLSYIFSKKRVGWMIAALVLFTIDTLIFIPDMISVVMAGGIAYYIIDILFRIWAFVSIVMAVIYGTKAKEEAKEIEVQTNEQMVAEAISVENGETVEEPDVQRTLTITRAKKYAGCAVPIICYVNGEQVCMLKNGKSESVQVTGNSFELGATLKNGLAVDKVTVPAGTDALNYRVYVKWGMVVATLVVEPVINN